MNKGEGMKSLTTKLLLCFAAAAPLASHSGGEFRDTPLGPSVFDDFYFCRTTLEDIKKRLPEGVFIRGSGSRPDLYAAAYKSPEMKERGTVRFPLTPKSHLMTGVVVNAPYAPDLHQAWVETFRGMFGHQGDTRLTRSETWRLKDGVAFVEVTRDELGNKVILASMMSTKCILYR